MKRRRLRPLSPSDVSEIRSWYAENEATLPDIVKRLWEHYEALLAALAAAGGETRSLLAELRRALGITPSSERRRSEKAPGDRRARLVASRGVHLSRADWHKGQGRKHLLMARDVEKKLKSLDDVELSAEDQATIQEEMRRLVEIAESGGDPDPRFASPSEALMVGTELQCEEDQGVARLDEGTRSSATRILTETRTRFGLDFALVRLEIEVEKAILPHGAIASASTWEFGPPHYEVTWDFLASEVILVTQYAIPMNRLAGMVSTAEKRFTSASLYRLLHYAAERLLPVYLELGRTLAHADLLSGDDTTVRVTEVSKALAAGERPWKSFATQDEAQKNLPQAKEHDLAPRLAAELGFEFEKRTGSGPKQGFHTTVVWGRTDEAPESHVVFYRSHLGSFGNLLEVLLTERKKSRKKLLVQSDLSTANLIAKPEILNALEVTFVGCASHARRPFALYEKDDPLCSAILAEFRCLYDEERTLDLWGRNETNVSTLRKEASLTHWKQIRAYAEVLVGRWSPGSKVGEGARYILKHFDKLTAYLENPRVPLSNDLSERMLRMEKLIQVNSLFRTTLEGRFALDICRTVLQTAVAARVNLRGYLLHVFKATDVAEQPQNYLPLVYARTHPAEA